MNDIKSKLQNWKDSTPNSEFETISTITLKTDTLNLSVHGDSLESAYQQIENICKNVGTIPSMKITPTLDTNNSLQTSTTPSNIINAFGDKKPIRIYNPNVPLAAEESTVEYNGLTYVVK